MRSKHHRRYQGCFSRLASRYRSLFTFVLACIALLLILAATQSAQAQTGPAVRVSRGAATYTVAEDETVTINHTVTVGDYETNGVTAFSVGTTVPDDEAPVLLSTVVGAATLTLTYDEPLDAGSVAEPEDFTVPGGDHDRTVTRIGVSGRALALTLNSAVKHGETGITVSYRPGINPIQDTAGNDAGTFTKQEVENKTPDRTEPTVSMIEITFNPPDNRDTYAIGDVIEATVTFSEAVEVTGSPWLELTVGDTRKQADYDRGTGTAALVFTYTVAEGDTDDNGVSINADSLLLDGGAIRDKSGNAALLDHEGLADDPWHKVDGGKPVLAATDGAVVDGATLMLTYNELLDGGSIAAPEDFTVRLEGAKLSVSEVLVSGRVVELTLDPEAEHEETGITVSYTPWMNPIRDAVGNDASDFTEQAVTKRTGDRGGRVGGALALGAVRQIETLLAEKAQRTSVQRKVNSQLLDAASKPPARASAEARGQPPMSRVADLQAPAEVAADELVTVDIRADVTPAVLARIQSLGGTVVNSIPKYRAIRARLPLAAVEPLATLDAVQTIRVADEAVTRAQVQGLESNIRTDVLGTGGIRAIVDTSEGDVAHQANLARTTHGVDGSGIGIGVISDGVETLADQQATGDVPARVTILPGQQGGSAPLACGVRSTGTEGTAMLEIVYDLAPGAELFFATGISGAAQMAQNIENLCAAGADVIVDDLGYLEASVFQDDVIAQAISTATANGCYYFSSAGNGGNKNDETASVWEGDFAAGSALTLSGVGSGATFHDFGGGAVGNEVTMDSTRPIVLQWADPVGGSANDYDLFLIDANDRVLASSTNTQDGTQDPIEFIRSSCDDDREGTRLVIVKNAGAADRYLRLAYAREGLAITTAGHTFGHSASQDAIGVAAVDVADAGGTGGVFNGTESVETFSSDGPRRIFFEADGTPITPGNFSSTGGEVLNKPDLAAADAVSTSTHGFSTFKGTSAAAPHAAAIAALMLEAAGGPDNVTPAALRTAMTGAALDIEATGVDRDSGAGIVMAPGAVDAVDIAVADRNGAPTVSGTVSDRTFALGDAAVTFDVASAFSDPDNDTLTYTVLSSDPDRVEVSLTGSMLTLTPKLPGLVVVTVRAVDAHGLSVTLTFSVAVAVGTRDYDVDDDGLIEVSNLAQLDAVRYDLNGDGIADVASDWQSYYADAAFAQGAIDMGCPNGCTGYELTASLDFDTNGSGAPDAGDDYWNNGTGWVPIGDSSSSFSRFAAIFEGNGRTITNLFIDRSGNDIGLFGETRGSAVIRNLEMVSVQVTGTDNVGGLVGSNGGTVSGSYATGRVSGKENVGGLVGSNGGPVSGSYATGRVSGVENVGGLVGMNTNFFYEIRGSYATGRVSGVEKVGGLVGFNEFGKIRGSYATGRVSGVEEVGGLVGSNNIFSEIRGSYATGRVSGVEEVGGLVGFNGYFSKIHSSYATGRVSGDYLIGGLVGENERLGASEPNRDSINGSYWDTSTSGHTLGRFRIDKGKTTAELQAPTDYSGIYRGWNQDFDGDDVNDDPWDFGTSSEYPALRADMDGNDDETWQEFGYQIRSGPTLTATPTTNAGHGQVELEWTEVPLSSDWTPAPSVSYTVTRYYDDTIETIAENLTVREYTDTDVAGEDTYIYQVAAVVDGGEVARSATVSVTAAGNKRPVAVGTLRSRLLLVGDSAMTEVGGAFQDPEGDTITYDVSSSDTSVARVTLSGTRVTIIPVGWGFTTITVTATDDGSNQSRTQQFTVEVLFPTTVDYDTDDDGLIEISNLAQLDAVRHDLGGYGASKSTPYDEAFSFDLACGGLVGCVGYELNADLDFDTDGSGEVDAGDTYWNNGAGWMPIGDSSSGFAAIFEGNGRTITNLFIDRSGNEIGLFGGTSSSAVIRNLEMVSVQVTGIDNVGGLVGANGGTVSACYATGKVSGDDFVGGVVGANLDDGSVSASYSTVHVTGDDRIGGLAGSNSGTVTATYATGRVVGDSEAGGLIGRNTGELNISYATVLVSGRSTIGGLVGRNSGGGTITDSYWDSDTSGHTTGSYGQAKNTAELQLPTAASDIYLNWNVDLDGDSMNDDPWDFGTSSQYPVLSVDTNGVGGATWEEFGYQLREGSALTATFAPAGATLSWTTVDADHWDPMPDVAYTLYRNVGATTITTLAENSSGLSYTDTDVTDGATYTYQVAAVVDGGEATRSAQLSVTVPDRTPPTVSTIAISSDPGTDRTYAAGDEIRVTVTFSETVAVTGTPQLRLELGGGSRTATYEGGSGTAALVFAYEVANGESDTDGVGVEADSLSGGTIRDEALNNAEQDHDGLTADSSHKVDGVKPQLAATGGALVDGTTLTLTYDEPLDGSSTAASGDFTVSGGDQTRTVTRVSVSGSTVELTLDAGAEHLEAGIQVSYTPGMNPIRDAVGNAAEALSRVPVTNETPDTTSPTMSSLAITSNPGSDQTYAAGDEIEVTVRFSETVEVEGTQQLRMRVGSRTRTAGYLRGTGTAALVFGYEVADGDEDTDGVSIEAGRIALNGGTIEDEADNDAVLDHEAVAPQAGHKVDGVRPELSSAAVDGSSLTLTYGEALDGGSRPTTGDFTVQVGSSERTVNAVDVVGTTVTLTLNPAVEHGDTGIRVSYSPGTNPIRDAVGNEAEGLSSRSVTNTTGAPNTTPVITSVGPFTVPENQALAGRLEARDTDPGDELTGWAIVGGADQGQFTITSDTGELSFRTAPDFEAPGDNEYEVTVEVRSGAGARELEAEETFTVRVTDEREPPGVPEALTFSGETADSLTVSWSEPDNTGPAITDYDVQYREKSTGRFSDGQHEGSGLSLTLDDLEPGTVYEVQVRATNEEGTSGWSGSGEGMTVVPLTLGMTSSNEPPVEGPFTVRFSFSEPVTGFNSGDIEAGQDPACTDDQNNPVFCDPGIGTLDTVDDRVFTTTVTPWTDRVAHNYTLTLTVSGGAVRSSVGNKPNEQGTLEVRVAPPGVTVPISSIGLRENSGNGQVTLNWNRPPEDGGSAIIRYEYRFAVAGEDFSAWENLRAGTRRVTVGGLIDGTEYVFEVRAVNALGKGPAETVSATPDIVSPPPPPGGGGFPPPPPPPAANNSPTADAGPDQTGVWEGALVTLDGSGSSDPDGDPLRYRWNQFSGESVVLSSQNVANPTFTAPEGLTADAVLSFRLLVTDPSGHFDSDTVTITVEQGTSPPVTEEQTYYFPHLAVGDGWQTTITYINYSSEEVTCRTEFLSDQGTPLLVSFADRGMVPSRTDVLQPGESVHEETNVTLSAPRVAGWARAACTGPVKASLLYRRFEGGVPTGEAGVNATTVPATRFVTFAEQGEGQHGTGVAYANPSDTQADITFTVLDADGETLASDDQMLSPNGHGAKNMVDLFDLSSFSGSLEVTSTEPIVSLSLNNEADPVFSSLPPGELDTDAQGPQQMTIYYFPHLAVGEGWQTTITYINYSPQEVSCQTEFLSDHGSPLLVSFAGRGMDISRTDVLPLGGSVHEETNVELSAPRVAGWARATCSGPVKASLLYRRFEGGVPTGEAGVNAITIPATRFVTFAEQGEGQHGTGVAYANPSDTTTAFVTFTVRDAAGQMLASSAPLTLLPRGHDAKNLVDLFGLSSFTGSLEITSTAPIVSLSLNNEADPVFSSLPPGELDAAAQ